MYSIVPALGLAGIMGANFVSAHGFFGGLSSLTPDQTAEQQQTMFQNEANLLGISVDDVKNAWAQGKTLATIAEEHGITQDQLKQKMKDAKIAQLKSGLQMLVDKGVITQTQADQRLQSMQTRLESATGKRGHMGMMRWHGGFGF